MRTTHKLNALLALAGIVLAPFAHGSQVRIMPLGDSITFGSPDRDYGGYRRLLGTLLADDGYPAAFVGSRESGNGAIPSPANEGHPGWTIQQLRDGIDSNGWLETYRPDLILLHIGTNDLRQGGADAAPGSLSALLDDILSRLPRTRVLVAQIIPFRRGSDPVHRAYNAAIPGIAASKGPRVIVVDMQNILEPGDYADGLHPNAAGYDKMARAWEPAIRAALSGGSPQTGPPGAAVSAAPPAAAEKAASAPPPGTPAPAGAMSPAATAGPTRRYVPGSSVKVEQLLGEVDKQLRRPTLSLTASRYGIEGTDLGYSFEHDGQVYFLFGDTVGRLDRALDTIATTDATDPESGVRLDFLKNGGDYLTIQPPGISMGAFEVPVTGISLGRQIYVAVSTDHSEDRTTDRSVLTRFTPPADFRPLRTISQLPEGRFVKMSAHLEPSAIPGLPSGGPYVLIWGTGTYRRSDAYLSIVPAAQFESGEGTRYFAGLDAAGAPSWSEKESDAQPVVRNGTIGDLSVTWCKDLALWLMTYDSRPPAAAGIEFSCSRTPWGPWSEPQVIFNAARDGAAGKFIHDPNMRPSDGLAGPVIGKGRADPEAVHGGAYAPYVVERWTKVKDRELTLYYVLSTWNPYVVVLMKSRLHIE
jgi:lysophospholipase L1-like esterase